MLFIWFSNADERAYRRGQRIVISVLEAEKEYYDRHGEFTAKMDELEVELLAFSQETYEESRMEFDHGWFEWPAYYKAQTAKGDYFVVSAEGLQRSTRDAPLLTIGFFPAHAPAGYEVVYGQNTAAACLPLCYVIQNTYLATLLPPRPLYGLRSGWGNVSVNVWEPRRYQMVMSGDSPLLLRG